MGRRPIEDTATLREYFRALPELGHEGLDRSRVTLLLRRFTTPDMRFRMKLAATSALAPVARRKVRRLMEEGQKLRVNLGSGQGRVAGWVNIDLVGMGADVPWNLKNGAPLPPGTASAVFLEHVLEHFRPADALGLVEMAHRMLVPGGIIRVGTPDFGEYMRSYAGDGRFVESNRPGRPTRLLAVAEVITCHGHLSAWDGETLTRLLEAAGFESCTARGFGESWIEPAPDTALRKQESIYAEGVKP